MNKALFASLFLLFFYTAEAAQIVNSAQSMQNNTKIAVLDFQSKGTPEHIGSAIADIITTEFKKDRNIIILERSQIQKILKERSYRKTSSPDLFEAVEFGQILAVDRIIIGSVSKIGKTYTITGKIVEIKSGEIVHAESVNCGEEDDIEAASRYLAINLLNTISLTYHEPPGKNYFSKSDPDPIDVSFIVRFGIIPGFKVPQISVPEQMSDKIKITAKEEDVSIIEGITASDFYIYKGFAFRGLIKYSQSSNINSNTSYSSVDDSSNYYIFHQGSHKATYQGYGLGVGVQYSFNYTRLDSYYFGADLVFNRCKFERTFEQDYAVEAYDNNTNVGLDAQYYTIDYAQFSNVLSTEIAFGFKHFFTEKYGMNFSFGAEIPVYGALFTDFNMKYRHNETDDNAIPSQFKDLDTKLKYDEKDFVQPPMYFIQLGFFVRM